MMSFGARCLAALAMLVAISTASSEEQPLASGWEGPFTLDKRTSQFTQDEVQVLSNFRLAFKVKVDGIANRFQYQSIFQFGARNTNRAPGFFLRPNSRRIHMSFNDGTGFQSINARSNLPDGEWSTVEAIVYNGQVTLSINDNVEAEHTLKNGETPMAGQTVPVIFAFSTYRWRTAQGIVKDIIYEPYPAITSSPTSSPSSSPTLSPTKTPTSAPTSAPTPLGTVDVTATSVANRLSLPYPFALDASTRQFTFTHENVTVLSNSRLVFKIIVKGKASQSQYQSIFQFGDTNTNRAPGFFLQPNTRRIHMSFNDGTGFQSINAKSELPEGEWSTVEAIVHCGRVTLSINNVVEAVYDLKNGETPMAGQTVPILFAFETYPWSSGSAIVKDILYEPFMIDQ